MIYEIFIAVSKTNQPVALSQQPTMGHWRKDWEIYEVNVFTNQTEVTYA